ncbi:DNA-binding domain-containing protein [Paramaledivibacter caminithermalis]|uniref:Stage 0 sporulation protein A homolog n=1 Tax=Paramaledivibacter caminithermalis (strain DSM 15212 / CIP 107654 / DViRD3) TaxID=1121301 RepID=A0A1M6TMN5_PARC5|nr:DNA-binding domain-containing protein [Paramaledivibacter caminithermalis]SHK58255.1 two-component system, response regulator YcbB [Paramaledivibacter caminithermalis DSM 15212]
MKFYIVDDDINIVKILQDIIEEKKLGEVVGYSYDGDTALKDILEINPDIVLIDYLMPNKDGASLTKEIRKITPDIYFIIISQVSDKEMIAESYNSGIEFFITKPINIIEVEKVIKSVSQKIEMSRAISNIKGMLKLGFEPDKKSKLERENQINRIKYILSSIGILGEKGSYDIIKICQYMIENENDRYIINDINDICLKLGENPKIMKQRMRRAIMKGIRNIANTGIEDYMNECFVKYSNSLFDFESVKAEMDYIRGKRVSGGKVNVIKFIENILVQSQLF